MKLEADGYDQADIVTNLANKFRCSKDAIWYDFRIRSKWQPLLTEMNPSMLALRIHNRLDQAYKKASWLLLTSKNENVQLGAIHLQLEATKALIDFVGPIKNVEGPYADKTEQTQMILKEYEGILEQAAELNLQLPGRERLVCNDLSPEEIDVFKQARNIIKKHENHPAPIIH